MSLSSLPEDIRVDIFKTLPLNTIGISRCVCNWHDSHSEIPRRGLYSVDYASISSALSSTLPITRNLNRVVIPKEAVVREHLPFENINDSLRIMGSSNGLVCLGFETEISAEVTICLWNPLTRDFKVVPSPDCGGSKYEVRYGFGYDPICEDYKLVRIGFNGVEVYTLGTDSWRFIPREPEGYPYRCPRGKHENTSGLLFNGALHWLRVRITGDYDHVVVSFDISNELLTEFTLPKQPSDANHTRLGVWRHWRDCLCLVFSTHCRSDIWVMQNYGVRDSWNQHFTHNFTRYCSPGKPIWSFENGEVLIETDFNFILLDPENVRVRILDIGDVVCYKQSESYIQSLVSLKSE